MGTWSDNVAVRLGAYIAVLAVVFTAALGIGSALDGFAPAGRAATSPHAERQDGTEGARHEEGGAGTDHGNAHSAGAEALPGLSVSAEGYTLVPRAAELPTGPQAQYAFTVEDRSGRPLRAYEPNHEKELHLVVVRRDLASFQHVHPDRAADGTWSVPLDLSDAGAYRVFADFVPAGHDRSVTLGTDLSVAGTYDPTPLPEQTASAAVDGYQVTLAGRPAAGVESDLTFTVRKDGAPVTDLQPYLGAYGHLVSLRAGDLAYLHTHPADEALPGRPGGPEIQFGTEFPTRGSYRLFLDFQVGGTVRTAAFTVEVP